MGEFINPIDVCLIKELNITYEVRRNQAPKRKTPNRMKVCHSKTMGYIEYGMSFEIHVPNNNQFFSDIRF